MIDWQIKINGKLPTGWNQIEDGGYFPDFDHQEFLLPYFDVADEILDPVGKCVFYKTDLLRLKTRLLVYLKGFEIWPNAWSVTTSNLNNTKTIQLNRDTVLETITNMLSVIEKALELEGEIEFRGD